MPGYFAWTPKSALPEPRSVLAPVAGPALVFGVVLAACLAGILLRPPGLLSSFWTANAVLLGLLLHRPALATTVGWIAAVCGYLAADLLTGSTLFKTSLLTTGNIVGVFVAFALFRRVGFEDVQLSRPHSVGQLLLFTLVGSLAAGVVGTVANPLLFNGGPIQGFGFWLVTEFANYIAILPIVLVAPGFRDGVGAVGAPDAVRGFSFIRLAPALACLASLAVATTVGGVSALAVPVPALVWCALSYGVPLTTLLSFAFAVWALVLPVFGVIPDPAMYGGHHELIALRAGVSLIALTPVVIASAMTSRAAALREAEEARQAAEDAMSARSLLLAAMAHELRTPLNAIVGLSTILEMKPPLGVEKPEHREHATQIHLGGLHLAELVTDLLDTARVEAGEIELAMQQVGSRATIEQSLRLVTGIAMQAKVRFDLAGEDWPDVIADARAIMQVMINLLSNAVKFSPRGGSVVISAHRAGERLVLSVKDSGPGIAPADLARLGRPYAQTTAGKARSQSSGLGLSLSKDLIRKHGGELQLQSTLGDGMTVTFDLAVA
ncbi:MAG TPA: ATP-binding protein [Hyphomonadaceae bacterium]|nr:ATP-binding protein [Hyphomonadaceae bacterium]HPN07570.1 ATP-binding protein [Hyphomonadaceae bacterium]